MRIPKPSPALALAFVALLVALGGSSFAAPAREAASKLITGKQIKNGSIGTTDLSKKARKALKGKTGKTGPAGAQGLQGAKGDRGLQGVAPASEAWHEVGATGEPAFTDGVPASTCWGNFPAGTSPNNSAGFFKDAAGVVHLKGMVNEHCGGGGADAGVPIFTLPAGYRPAKIERQATVQTTDAPEVVLVSPNGDVTVDIEPATDDSTNYTSLDGITFRAAG
jgi:hypothetical protein